MLLPLPLVVVACAGPRGPGPLVSRLPRTRAERTDYRETSRYADVVAFVDTLRALGVPMRVGSMGRSTEGRDIPYVVASRPLVSGPDEARRLGRPVVYVQANIHAGEVEGKEALQMLVRDLLVARTRNALDSIVLVAVPIYNADGNERVASQAVNRTEQNGPELVGQRANGQGLDLNRDYVKAEAPETRAALALLNEWDPDLFVDLHTTDGSFHGYALTYASSLSPAAALGPYTRDSVLPELRRRMRERHGFETFDYGNFSLDYGADVDPNYVKKGWYSYDHRPRFGTNYYGIRGRLAILSEAYSHDPFERRVRATYWFVSEILSWAAARPPMVSQLLAGLHRSPSLICQRGADVNPRVVSSPPESCTAAIRAQLTNAPAAGDVLAEDLERVADTTALTEPGVPRGLRRTGRFRTLRMPVYDRFMPTEVVGVPPAYALDASQANAARLLRLHGLTVEQLSAGDSVDAQLFDVDSVVLAPNVFQGHREVRVRGRWRGERRHALAAGAFVVRTGQPLGVLAAYLLEPESDDGLATWNVFDRSLREARPFPVARLLALPTAASHRAER